MKSARSRMRVVVVGNGPAAHRFVEQLRKHGHSGPVTVLGAERYPAYNRFLLGSVLDGTLDPAITILPALDADVWLGVTVTGIDRARRVVRTFRSEEHHYDVLVLAVGSRAAQANIMEQGAGRWQSFRTMGDCAALDGVSGPIAVLGGGVLGVEIGYALRKRGDEVALVHPGETLLDNRLDKTTAALLAEELRTRGITVHLGRTVTHYEPGRLGVGDGEVPAELVVACTGAVPETALAGTAGLRVCRGIVVDDTLRTSDPNIHAIGDCAEHAGATSGFVTPAWEQADVLAAILTGHSVRYRGTPTVVRPRLPGIDLVSVGSVSAATQAAAKVMTVSDPARKRSALLAFQQDRIVGASAIGFAQGIASLTQSHVRGTTVRADRLAWLLGQPTTLPEPAAATVAATTVCVCNNVTVEKMLEEYRRGARTTRDLARTTRATTGCGRCADTVERLCSEWTDGAKSFNEDVA